MRHKVNPLELVGRPDLKRRNRFLARFRATDLASDLGIERFNWRENSSHRLGERLANLFPSNDGYAPRQYSFVPQPLGGINAGDRATIFTRFLVMPHDPTQAQAIIALEKSPSQAYTFDISAFFDEAGELNRAYIAHAGGKEIGSYSDRKQMEFYGAAITALEIQHKGLQTGETAFTQAVLT